MKKIIVIFFFYANFASAQKIFFSDNFEQKKIDSAWQIVSGKWRIVSVEDLRIAPAEKGYRYVLCCFGIKNDDNQIIRLIIDLPDSLKAKKLKLSFSYYILANVSGTKIETEFYQKEIKDGLRGQLWVGFLPRAKGRWKEYKQTLTIPAKANVAYMTFFGFNSSGVNDTNICFDNIIISTAK